MHFVILSSCVLAGCVSIPTAFAEGLKPEDPKQGTVQQSAQLEAEPDQKIEIETYSRPRMIERPNPKYPRSAQKRGREGWAVVQYMVDAQGSTYDWEVIDYSGGKDFGKAALEAAKKYRYEPAQFEGRAIDAGAATKISFALSGGSKGATTRFLKRYKKFMKLLQSVKEGVGDEQKMEEAFSVLEKQGAGNLYEDSFINIARASYHIHHDDQWSGYVALIRAVGHERQSSYLSKATLKSLHTGIFWMQV